MNLGVRYSDGFCIMNGQRWTKNMCNIKLDVFLLVSYLRLNQRQDDQLKGNLTILLSYHFTSHSLLALHTKLLFTHYPDQSVVNTFHLPLQRQMTKLFAQYIRFKTVLSFFFAFLVVWSFFWSSSFLFIWSFGFGLWYQLVNAYQVAQLS